MGRKYQKSKAGKKEAAKNANRLGDQGSSSSHQPFHREEIISPATRASQFGMRRQTAFDDDPPVRGVQFGGFKDPVTGEWTTFQQSYEYERPGFTQPRARPPPFQSVPRAAPVATSPGMPGSFTSRTGTTGGSAKRSATHRSGPPYVPPASASDPDDIQMTYSGVMPDGSILTREQAIAAILSGRFDSDSEHDNDSDFNSEEPDSDFNEPRGGFGDGFLMDDAIRFSYIHDYMEEHGRRPPPAFLNKVENTIQERNARLRGENPAPTTHRREPAPAFAPVAEQSASTSRANPATTSELEDLTISIPGLGPQGFAFTPEHAEAALLTGTWGKSDNGDPAELSDEGIKQLLIQTVLEKDGEVPADFGEKVDALLKLRKVMREAGLTA